ncbi:MAG: 50S ribosomal protein L11 methyltransferase [Lewinellaceae bacterium]|nr:50S ribosomal protein L11 methyltransferase [Saprospiraceae bacterium]MCB9311591.1 50S ribosomal protein L11 methyltransferase [Lewinellaceae bacterium]HRW75593.1 50S ribosomal protein L11 methyltransferase [Saprospiraceae bacterium]
MTWKVVKFLAGVDQREIALAILAEYPFTAFQETEDGLEAYISAVDWTADLQEALHREQGPHWTSFSVSEMADQNWNQLWESNFEPVDLAPFCVIRAVFHEPRPDVLHDLVIQPERAFGTGHHATTRMMVQGLEHLELGGKSVLDFGAGTAVLAILAARLGAGRVTAVEIEEPACISAQSNVERNGVEDRVTIVQGDLHAVPGLKYHLILANINRNVLLESISTLDQHLWPGGRIGLSGYLPQDCPMLEESCQRAGWQLERTTTDTGWIAQWWLKPENS